MKAIETSMCTDPFTNDVLFSDLSTRIAKCVFLSVVAIILLLCISVSAFSICLCSIQFHSTDNMQHTLYTLYPLVRCAGANVGIPLVAPPGTCYHHLTIP